MESSASRYSRRAFLSQSVAAGGLAGAAPDSPPQPHSPAGIDIARLISRADLVYEKPAPRSEEGMPVGNGRMGSLVWTTPSQLRLQINRVDLYASNSASNSFFERNDDYCGGCGYVDVDFGDGGNAAFPETGFAQQLSVYNGLMTLGGTGISASVVAWTEQDVMAIELDDRRGVTQPVQIRLRMLRYESQYFGQKLEDFARDHIVAVQHRSQTAASRLAVHGARIVLEQEFREGSFYCRSAVAVGIAGRAATARILNETDVAVTAPAGPGKFTVLIASAATFDPNENITTAALAQLEAAASKGYPAIAHETAEWWHAFWTRGFVSLHSADGEADFVEQNYTWFIYLMAASSRGKFPTKFNGMLWNTAGDLRTWGAQHWFANLSCYYEALFAANRLELLDPVFDMYSDMHDACSLAARQQWGSQGMYIPETAYFDGLEKLPDEIAAEMRELYLLRQPWDRRSPRFIEFSRTKMPHSSRWNWIEKGGWIDGRWVTVERGSGPYGPVTHILGSNAKIAYLYWRRYEFTLDKTWLRERAYPMLRGAAEFYRNFPNVAKDADGLYHINRVNSNESVWGARDTDEDLSAMRGVFPALLRASEILGVDNDMRPQWRELLDRLAPLPLSSHPDALRPPAYNGPTVFVRGLKPAVKAAGLLPDGNSLPMWFFDLCNLESSDGERLKVANTTFDAWFPNGFRSGIATRTPVGVLSKLPIAAASLGRADAVRWLVPNQMRILTSERSTAYKKGGALANRMTLREGPQALAAEHLGRAAEALHLSLLQSNPPSPGEEAVLRVFPACPPEWTARFALRARGGFVVSSSLNAGRVEFVELSSEAGASCRLRNPWGGAPVTLYRDGAKAETLRDSLLEFATRKGERILLKG